MSNIFSVLRGNSPHSGIDQLVNELNNKLQRTSVSQETGRAVTMATESLMGDSALAAQASSEIGGLQDMIASVVGSIESVNLNTLGTRGEKQMAVEDVNSAVARQLGDLSLASAAQIAAAFANPVGYAEAAMRQHSGMSGVTSLSVATEGVGGSIVTTKPMALEKFSEVETRKMMGWSIVLAATGAKQDAFTEAFFPYVMVGAGDMGLSLSVARAQILSTPNHDQSGNPNDFTRTNLVDTARHPELLEDESTRLFPVVHQDPNHPSRKFFVPGAATRSVTVEQNTFQTAPIAFGLESGLINLSTPDYLVVPGVMELTDAIGPGARVESVLIQIEDDLIPFRTRELNGFGFLPAREGQEQRQVINATTKNLVLTGNTLNDQGVVPAATQLLRDHKLSVVFGIVVNGDLDLQNSINHVTSSIKGVYSVIDENGEEVSTEAGTVGAQVLALFSSAKPAGWYPFAVRTNENQRTLGRLFDTLEERFCYAIPLTAPFAVLAPVGSTAPAKNLETLIAAQRRRQAAAGVSTLLNHLGMVEELTEARKAGLTVRDIGSVGARLTKAWFRRVPFDCRKVLSLRENDKSVDLAAKLINTIRIVASEMAVESGYLAALEESVSGSKELTMLVGTSVRIHQLLQTDGDPRTFGPLFQKTRVVSTLNHKMDDKVIVSFTREAAAGEPDLLQFGWCAGLPELVTVVETRRGGSLRKEAMTQGRYLHIPNLPFGFIVDVAYLEEALQQETYSVSGVSQGETTPGSDPFPGGNGSGNSTGGGADAGSGNVGG